MNSFKNISSITSLKLTGTFQSFCKAILLSTLCAFTLSLPAQADTSAMPEPGTAIKINVNTADVEELSIALQGVGETRAKAIVDYREQYGSFKSVDDLVFVKGIGEKTLSDNRYILSVTSE